ncbi:DUF1028 domain-containing protein [Ferruginivarius sediminum]|uniref:DUF1028 domain-containing protein n=2 Tax=Ferruginivarius sediminum TaxID=2661937 RepID=A0A369T5R6_9PROT|nr:DUF1028 domain-containing protein [Ferruginivarius sediminum]
MRKARMTFSIVAREPSSGRLGVAVTTCHFAVGATVPFARAGCGGLATQASTNPLYGVDGLLLLEQGMSAAEVVSRLTGADRGREHRQVIVVGANGDTAGWTGEETVGWAGHKTADSVAVAGNMLTGPHVVDATLAAYRNATGGELADRLLGALQAGEAKGGDKRGRQSAALYIVDTEPYAALDLRVDNHADPLGELAVLLRESRQPYVADFRASLPTRHNPHSY